MLVEVKVQLYAQQRRLDFDDVLPFARRRRLRDPPERALTQVHAQIRRE